MSYSHQTDKRKDVRKMDMLSKEFVEVGIIFLLIVDAIIISIGIDLIGVCRNIKLEIKRRDNLLQKIDSTISKLYFANKLVFGEATGMDLEELCERYAMYTLDMIVVESLPTASEDTMCKIYSVLNGDSYSMYVTTKSSSKSSSTPTYSWSYVGKKIPNVD